VSAVDPLPQAATRRPIRWGPIGLAVAVVFLAGAIGFLLGSRGSETPTGPVDEGFLLDMSDHHDQAVTMALFELANGQDSTTREFATEILVAQRQELGQMARMLAERNVARPDFDADRRAMGWMGMSVTASTMPGMASADDLARLRASRGNDADELFLTLMQAHHAGGVHMAQNAAEDAEDPAIRALADRMATVQATEIKEYQVVLDRLRGGSA
jgi:uncharacterized protein (DUF305 family)